MGRPIKLQRPGFFNVDRLLKFFIHRIIDCKPQKVCIWWVYLWRYRDIKILSWIKATFPLEWIQLTVKCTQCFFHWFLNGTVWFQLIFLIFPHVDAGCSYRREVKFSAELVIIFSLRLFYNVEGKSSTQRVRFLRLLANWKYPDDLNENFYH